MGALWKCLIGFMGVGEGESGGKSFPHLGRALICFSLGSLEENVPWRQEAIEWAKKGLKSLDLT